MIPRRQHEMAHPGGESVVRPDGAIGILWGMRKLYVYILASESKHLYVGVTNNLRLRVETHRNGGGKFTSRHRIYRLVYYELVGPPIAAIRREKHLKRWKRLRKIQLIESVNRSWRDLAPQ